MDLPMGPSVCVKFAHVINETCDRPPFSLITYANVKNMSKSMVGELIDTTNMSNCSVGVHNQFFECAHLPCNCSL